MFTAKKSIFLFLSKIQYVKYFAKSALYFTKKDAKSFHVPLKKKIYSNKTKKKLFLKRKKLKSLFSSTFSVLTKPLGNKNTTISYTFRSFGIKRIYLNKKFSQK